MRAFSGVILCVVMSNFTKVPVIPGLEFGFVQDPRNPRNEAPNPNRNGIGPYGSSSVVPTWQFIAKVFPGLVGFFQGAFKIDVQGIACSFQKSFGIGPARNILSVSSSSESLR